jgi:hypothetical protein
MQPTPQNGAADAERWADRQALDVMAVDAAHALKETTTVAASHKMSI